MKARTILLQSARSIKSIACIASIAFASLCATNAAASIPMEHVLGSFREPEGLTLIMAREAADLRGLPYDHVMAWLTLTVHSSLAAVGLTAAVAAALAQANISCNVWLYCNMESCTYTDLFCADVYADFKRSRFA